jgi:hypothetical protein
VWVEEGDVTDLSSPLSWFSCAPESLPSDPRDRIGFFPPLISSGSPGVQGFRTRRRRLILP